MTVRKYDKSTDTHLHDVILACRDKARKDKDTENLTFYTTILGEFDRVGKMKTGETYISDEKAEKVIGKMVSSNEEVLKHRPDDQLEKETEALRKFLPKLLTIEAVLCYLNDIPIGEADNDGQAIGMALRALAHESVDKKMVAKLVKELRGGNNDPPAS